LCRPVFRTLTDELALWLGVHPCRPLRRYAPATTRREHVPVGSLMSSLTSNGRIGGVPTQRQKLRSCCEKKPSAARSVEAAWGAGLCRPSVLMDENRELTWTYLQRVGTALHTSKPTSDLHPSSEGLHKQHRQQETKKGAIRLPFSVQRQLSAVAFSALLQLGIGLYAGGDLVVGCYVQISILNGLNHFLLGFQLQLLSILLVLGLAQLLGEFVTDFRNFLISLDKLLQIVIADRRSGRLTLLVLLLRSTSSLGHDSGSAHTEGGKGNGGGQSLEVFH